MLVHFMSDGAFRLMCIGGQIDGSRAQKCTDGDGNVFWIAPSRNQHASPDDAYDPRYWVRI